MNNVYLPTVIVIFCVIVGCAKILIVCKNLLNCFIKMLNFLQEGFEAIDQIITKIQSQMALMKLKMCAVCIKKYAFFKKKKNGRF